VLAEKAWKAIPTNSILNEFMMTIFHTIFRIYHGRLSFDGVNFPRTPRTLILKIVNMYMISWWNNCPTWLIVPHNRPTFFFSWPRAKQKKIKETFLNEKLTFYVLRIFWEMKSEVLFRLKLMGIAGGFLRYCKWKSILGTWNLGTWELGILPYKTFLKNNQLQKRKNYCNLSKSIFNYPFSKFSLWIKWILN
jgi:hypothetical protein